jgi:hypothetical protein
LPAWRRRDRPDRAGDPLAKRFAAARGLTIAFRVQDVCALADAAPTKRHDLIVGSYCLQSIARVQAPASPQASAERRRAAATARILPPSTAAQNSSPGSHQESHSSRHGDPPRCSHASRTRR